MTIDEIEIKLLTLPQKDLLDLFFELQLLKKEYFCRSCNNCNKLVKYSRNIDGYAWRCMKSGCFNYKKYYSIRDFSFFSSFNIPLNTILRVILRKAARQNSFGIIRSIDVPEKTVQRIMK